MNEGVSMSVRDMPLVDLACKCALPIVLSAIETPDYPSLLGTCFAIQAHENVLFVTAGHVVRDVSPETTRISIPLGPGRDWPSAEIAKLVRPVANEGFESALDLAIMVPTGVVAPSSGDFVPCSIERVANMAAVPTTAMFVVAGYPGGHPAGKGVDYDQRGIHVTRFISIGTYVGKSDLRGCHRLKLSTVIAGGPAGLSGSPVFRALHNEDGSWTPALAGLVITGNNEDLHFLDVAYLQTVLNNLGVS